MKAFPGNNNEYKEPFDMPMHHEGMDLRDYFAAKAMQGFASKYGVDVSSNNQDTLDAAVKSAYRVADKMMEYRK